MPHKKPKVHVYTKGATEAQRQKAAMLLALSDKQLGMYMISLFLFVDIHLCASTFLFVNIHQCASTFLFVNIQQCALTFLFVDIWQCTSTFLFVDIWRCASTKVYHLTNTTSNTFS
jgi:hypothetical protein